MPSTDLSSATVQSLEDFDTFDSLEDLKLFNIRTLAPPSLGVTDLTTTDTRTAWTADDWATYINAPEANPVLAIIERGRRLAEYKASVHATKQTGFALFCASTLKMSQRAADMLIHIAKWSENLEPVVLDSFPMSWRILYELSRIPAAEFNEAVESGKINPEMTRADAEALRGKAPPAPQPAALPPPTPQVRTASATPQPSQPTAFALPRQDEPLPWEGPDTIQRAAAKVQPESAAPTPAPRSRLYAEDVVTDPEDKARLQLTLAQGQIVGGADFKGHNLRFFIETYMKEFNASGVFATMQAEMSNALRTGSTVGDAKTTATSTIGALRKTMVEMVDRAIAEGQLMFVQRTASMAKAEKPILTAFHPETNVYEALNSAEAALRIMSK